MSFKKQFIKSPLNKHCIRIFIRIDWIIQQFGNKQFLYNIVSSKNTNCFSIYLVLLWFSSYRSYVLVEGIPTLWVLLLSGMESGEAVLLPRSPFP